MARVKADSSVNDDLDKTKNNTGGLTSEARSLLHSTLYSWKERVAGSRGDDMDVNSDTVKDKVWSRGGGLGVPALGCGAVG